jgi:hypothetical protein
MEILMLFLIGVGLTIANVISKLVIIKELSWKTVIDRSFFQWLTLFVVWVCFFFRWFLEKGGL